MNILSFLKSSQKEKHAIRYCEYCKSQLVFSFFEDGKETFVYQCNSCPILTYSYYYSNSSDRPPDKIMFYLDRYDKAYTWTNDFKTNSSYITCLSQPFEHSLIIKFPHIMKLNPDNIYIKFNFCVTFL